MDVIEPGTLTVVNIGTAQRTAALKEAGDRIELTGGPWTFASAEAEGDFDVTALLYELGGSSSGGEEDFPSAGVLIRGDSDSEGPYAALLVPTAGKPRLDVREVAGGGIRVVGEPYHAPDFPVWLKLERRGPAYHAWVSDDGLQWSHFASADVELPRQVRAGLTVVGGDRAIFSAMQVQELPSG